MLRVRDSQCAKRMARAAVPLHSGVALVVELGPSEKGACSHTGGHVWVVSEGMPVVTLPNAFGPPRLLSKGPQCSAEDVIHLERARCDALAAAQPTRGWIKKKT